MSRPKFLSPEEAQHRILQKAEGGKIFFVRFIKRSTGEEREMTCRLHVTKGVTGALPPGKRIAEDTTNACMTVYEMRGQESHFKRIPLDSVLEVR